VALLQAILHYTDLLTLRVFIPGDDGQEILPRLDQLAALAGLSYSRAQAALADLVDIGFVDSKRRFDAEQTKATGRWVGLPSARNVFRELFDYLGLSRKLHKARKAAYARAQKRAAGPRSRQEKLAAAKGIRDVRAMLQGERSENATTATAPQTIPDTTEKQVRSTGPP
jgi:hypothetical protein